jgi:hypothetical protein
MKSDIGGTCPVHLNIDCKSAQGMVYQFPAKKYTNLIKLHEKTVKFWYASISVISLNF